VKLSVIEVRGTRVFGRKSLLCFLVDWSFWLSYRYYIVFVDNRGRLHLSDLLFKLRYDLLFLQKFEGQPTDLIAVLIQHLCHFQLFLRESFHRLVSPFAYTLRLLEMFDLIFEVSIFNFEFIDLSFQSQCFVLKFKSLFPPMFQIISSITFDTLSHLMRLGDL
jgi:hypothetical protein